MVGRGSNGVVYDVGNGRVLKVLMLNGKYPITGCELERVGRLLARVPSGLFPRPTVIPGHGIEMDNVALQYSSENPAAITSLLLRAVTLLRDARVCYPDFHLGNLGGARGGPGVLLDPDALCDPWHDALLLGYYSPVGELAPAAFDDQPVAAAALGWYCTVFSACCTAVASQGPHGHAAASRFAFTQTAGQPLHSVHAALEHVLCTAVAKVRAPGLKRNLAALADLELEAFDQLVHVGTATKCLDESDAASASTGLAAILEGCGCQ